MYCLMKLEKTPKLTDCMAAAERANAEDVDYIIGIGGGSALDAAKCVAALAANPGMDRQQLFSLKWPNAPLKIVAVGTTDGTGSEVTKVSVLTTPEGQKKSIHHEGLYPAVSFGDPMYTMSLPPAVTCATAIDVLAHCAESFFSTAANHISRTYAVEGLRMLLPVLNTVAEKGWEKLDYPTREALYCASIYGGLAINVTGTCFPHTMGYLLTENFGLPHGIACAVFQKDFYSYNKEVAPALAAEFLERIGCSEEGYLELLENLIPACEISMEEELLRDSYKRWINNASLAKCQGVFDADAADAFLRKKFLKK